MGAAANHAEIDPADPATPSDADLIVRVRDGDAAAYGELWRRHRKAGLAAARSVTSSLDAEDLVSEAFAKILGAIRNGNGPERAFRPYLFTSIRNVAATWGGRQRATTPLDEAELELELADPAFGEDHVLAALDRSLTVRAFESLPARWREVLWYAEIEEMKPAEIAPLLGLKPTAVSVLAFRAREGLRRAWIEAHISSAPEGSECRWVFAHLGAHARKSLSGRDLVRMEAHLATDLRCRLVAAEASDVGSRLGLVLLPLALGVGGAHGYQSWLRTQAGPPIHPVPTAKATRSRHTGRARTLGSPGTIAVAAGLVAATAVAAVAIFAAQPRHPDSPADSRDASKSAPREVSGGSASAREQKGEPADGSNHGHPSAPAARPSDHPAHVASPKSSDPLVPLKDSDPRKEGKPSKDAPSAPGRPPLESVAAPDRPRPNLPGGHGAASPAMTRDDTPGDAAGISPSGSPSTPEGNSGSGEIPPSEPAAPSVDHPATMASEPDEPATPPAAPEIRSVDTGGNLFYPVITGSAVPGALVTVSRGSGEATTTMAEPDGAWATTPLDDYPAGDSIVEITQTVDGLVSAPAETAITLSVPQSVALAAELTDQGALWRIVGIPGAEVVLEVSGLADVTGILDGSGTADLRIPIPAGTTSGTFQAAPHYQAGDRRGPDGQTWTLNITTEP